MRSLSRRLRLVPTILVVAVAVALAFHMSPSRAGLPSDSAAARGVSGVAIAVADLDRSVSFYSSVLFFEKVGDARSANARVVTMRLGGDHIRLVQDFARKSRPATAAGRGFDHVAIVVNDMDQADLWLRRQGISPEPRTLPGSTASADGVRALAFTDPDGHALELLQFPAGKGDARWQRPSDRVFLGMDHAAIIVRDTERSLGFYRDALGLRVSDVNESTAAAPGRPNEVPGARLRITTVRAAEGPAIELVEYLGLRDTRAYPSSIAPADLAGPQALLLTADTDAAATRIAATSKTRPRPMIVPISDTRAGAKSRLVVRDPDGHGVELRAQ